MLVFFTLQLDRANTYDGGATIHRNFLLINLAAEML